MKIVVCDITGRTINYNVALCEALVEKIGPEDSVEYWSAGLTEDYSFKTHNFFSIVPNRFRSVAHKITRVMKAFDTVLAYIWILFTIREKKIDVFHLQWFPFISLGLKGSKIDLFFLKKLRDFCPNTTFVFTIHNMCPHRMKDEERVLYNPTYSKALNYFDKYIVHTDSTKREVMETLGLSGEKISVIPHGIFVPKDYVFSPSTKKSGPFKLLQYGFQHPYKGTDVFVRSLSYLPEDIKSQLEVTICGAFGGNFYTVCNEIETGINIKWIPSFLPDAELYDLINDSDILMFPYRRISQSGALLLALYTRKYIIASDIPTFVETLDGFPTDSFFKSEDPEDLARVIKSYVTGLINTDKIQSVIEKLNIDYSWGVSASKTLKLYNK